jgi:hypothetical protein
MAVQDDLGRRFGVLSRQFHNERVFESIVVLVIVVLGGESASTDWSISCDMHSHLLEEFHGIILLEVGVDLDLVNSWFDFSIRKDIQIHSNCAIADTNRLG